MQIEPMDLASLLLNNIPAMIVWMFGIVMAVIMLRRGGAGTEKLLLSGCSLMFIAALGGPFLRELIYWWLAGSGNNLLGARTIGLISLPMAIVNLAGIICLLLAFVLGFRKKKEVAA